MNESLRQFVRDRAGMRCEYCRLPEEHHELPFQMEHIVAKKHQGGDDTDNLAWSCYRCNAFKGPNIAGIDPESRLLTRLFHPRLDRWENHFSWIGPELHGDTAVGRTTIDVLRINHADSITIRRLLLALDVAF